MHSRRGAEKRLRLRGDGHGALYDRAVDRFCKPGDSADQARSDAEALGKWLQAMRGTNGTLAKGSQHRRQRGQVSAARRDGAGSKGGVRCNRNGQARGKKEHAGGSFVRQFFAAGTDWSAIDRYGTKANAVPGGL